jgi:hypothetical protein
MKEMTAGKVHKNKILWVKSIAPAAKLTSIILICEDEDGTCCPLALYNHFTDNTSLEYIQ